MSANTIVAIVIFFMTTLGSAAPANVALSLVVKHPGSASAYYNAGVQWENSGEWEKAFVALWAARQLDPRADDVRFHLDMTRGKLPSDVLESTPGWTIPWTWARWLSEKEVTLVLAVTWCWVALFIALALMRSHIIVAAVALGFALLVSAAPTARQAMLPNLGLATDQTKIFSGPGGEKESVIGALEAKTIARIDGQAPSDRNWLKIRTADGRRGWVTSKDLLHFVVAN